MPYDTAEIRSRLEARLRALEERLADIHETLHRPEDDGLEKQAVDLDHDEVLERLSHAGRDEALLVRAALKRIDENACGQYLSCGKAIPERRLRALSETWTCLRYAQRGSE